MTKKLVSIYNYGSGNLSSLKNAFRDFNCKIIISKDIKTIKNSDYIIFPGDGSYPMAMTYISQNKHEQEIKEILKMKIPVLGICLGMQIMAASSDEIKFTKGLSVIPGQVKYLPNKIPNIGWEKINFVSNKSKFFDLNNKYFYFLHSLAITNNNQFTQAVISDKNHSPAIVEKDNFIGVQFHPEKSQQAGKDFFSIFLEKF
tara:strand:- start:53 stop:655 length:603 start_codon:yes stop_codon:yes gene_type:complete